MKTKKQDLATRIYNLSLEIKHLIEENSGIPKKVVIEDFADLINDEFIEEMEDEDN